MSTNCKGNSAGAFSEEPRTKDYAALLENALKGKRKIQGATVARLVNQYNPMYESHKERRTLNSGRYLDEELCELLVEDRRASTKHHLQTDKVLKAFMLLVNENKHIMRT
uniref:Uncharacterized protein n=1 Tax=Trypanosoma congolense (strain IL3000) TaxID=1068625 RepID=G0UTR1_TRYCI|nr:conserved hypothetical protein [Trypanosoma congolense IL3000]